MGGVQLVRRFCPVLSRQHRQIWRRDREAVRQDDASWLCSELGARGPVLVKIGQFISSRRDVFAPELVDALRALQDHVPPMTPDDLMLALGGCSGQITVDPSPIASASIGQVHKATLEDGSVVVVKVRRRNIVTRILREVAACGAVLRLFEFIAFLSGDPEAVLSATAARRMLTDFQEVMLLECDYVNEAANMSLFRDLRQRDPHHGRRWVSPAVISRLCSETQIVMEYMPSVRFDAIVPHLPRSERVVLANQVMDMVVSHMLVDGLVHCDLQPGNIGIDARGRMVLYDFGNVVCLPQGLVRSLEDMLVPLMEGDVDAMVTLLNGLDVVRVRDEGGVRRYVELCMGYVRSMDISSVSMNAIDISALHSSRLPVEVDAVVLRLLRAIALAEGLCRSIDPSFTYAVVVRRYMLRSRVAADLRHLGVTW